MQQVICHIGLHKTASTSLQRQFLPACKHLHLLTTLDPKVRRLIHDITRQDPLYFDMDQARALVETCLSSTKVNLLSNESLSGPPYAGVVEWGLDHRSPVLSNLKSTLPNASIILVLRRQDTLARSLYRQYIKRGGTATVKRFFGLDGSDRPGLMSTDRFHFSPFLRCLFETFDRRVLVLTYEQFVQDQELFLTRFCEFIGVDRPDIEIKRENATRLGYRGMEVTRYLNFLMNSMLNHGVLPRLPLYRDGRWVRISIMELVHDHWPGRPNSGRVTPLQTAGDTILEMYREDNRMIDQEFGLGLDKFGYY